MYRPPESDDKDDGPARLIKNLYKTLKPREKKIVSVDDLWMSFSLYQDCQPSPGRIDGYFDKRRDEGEVYVSICTGYAWLPAAYMYFTTKIINGEDKLVMGLGGIDDDR